MGRKAPHPGTAERRREILLAALECFAEIGFPRTTMADIRRRAKASTGSIYHQFESKEHLAAEVFLEGIADYQAGWIAALERETDAREGLRAVIGHHVRWVRRNVTWARYLFERRHSISSAPARRRLARSNAQLLLRASAWFAVHVRARRLRRLPVDISVALLAGPYLEHTRQYLSGGECTQGERAIRLLADAAWRSLAAGPDPRDGSRRRRGTAVRRRDRRRAVPGGRDEEAGHRPRRRLRLDRRDAGNAPGTAPRARRPGTVSGPDVPTDHPALSPTVHRRGAPARAPRRRLPCRARRAPSRGASWP